MVLEEIVDKGRFAIIVGACFLFFSGTLNSSFIAQLQSRNRDAVESTRQQDDRKDNLRRNVQEFIQWRIKGTTLTDLKTVPLENESLEIRAWYGLTDLDT